jgi:ABC-type Fe3+/spermidine/putrescine transport system ATPase subunit
MMAQQVQQEGSASGMQSEMDLEIEGISKSFNGVLVVDRASLSVRRGEILAFLGPSGCGKSTLLQTVAGFVTPDAGEIRLRGRTITAVPPHRRGVGLVFQHYALFPHMTVRGNIEYGLNAAGATRADIARRVAEMVGLLKLGGLESRYPGELSGGQKQRVAIARTLAVRPDLLLLDEALSALDKNLREAMQIELSLLLRQLQITTVFVTHDQREAFGIADRIAVMEHGRVIQIDTPERIYRQPRSAFIADFLGSSSSVGVEVRRDRDGCAVISPAGLSFRVEQDQAVAGPGRLILRAEDITLSTGATAVHSGLPATVQLATFLGSTIRYVVALQDSQVVVEAPPGRGGRFSEGDQVFLDFAPERVHLVPAT